MNDSDYKTIHDQISEWCQRQLAATILSSIPSAMATLILSSLPDTFTADGLDILRAICRPHYGDDTVLMYHYSKHKLQS